jgi:hypothetical protein
MTHHTSSPHDQHAALKADLAADAALDALIAHNVTQTRGAYIDNADFSANVMQQIAALPPPVSTRQRMLVVSGITFAGIVGVTFFGGGASVMVDAAMDIATQTITPSVWAVAAMFVGMAAMGVVAATSER